MNSIVSCFLALSALSGLQLDYGLENTNIMTYDELSHFSDYNRLRGDLSLTHDKIEGVNGKVILDNETRYSEHPASLTNKGTIYRAYIKYEDDKNLLAVGRQRVPFGVGRLWNPIDVFNPVDSLAVETAERTGTESIRYEFSISELSGLDLTFSRDKNAARVKGFLKFGDIAGVAVVDNANDRDILGWEIEGEIFSTGIEFRSEGGSFNNRNSGERHTEFITGIEYGFANSLTLLTEYYFNDETKVDHVGWTASYQPALLWLVNVLQIINVTDGSSFISPSVNYSLADEMTISGGFFAFSGDINDEYDLLADKLFLNFYVHF